jgi:hypothetical protein
MTVFVYGDTASKFENAVIWDSSRIAMPRKPGPRKTIQRALPWYEVTGAPA